MESFQISKVFGFNYNIETIPSIPIRVSLLVYKFGQVPINKETQLNTYE